MLDVITVQPEAPPNLSVIWLHGLGADGHDFEPVVPHLNIPSNCSIRFVFPHAPVIPVTINMGMKMRAWYDILNPAIGIGLEDKQGIKDSCEQVEELIENEIKKGMKTQQVVLAGFSQGGAVALYTGLRYPTPLCGLLVLSSYLPLAQSTQAERDASNQNIPILYLHGSFDPVIPVGMAEQSRQQLSNLGYSVESKNYPIPHSVSAEEISDIGNWLTQRCKDAPITSAR